MSEVQASPAIVAVPAEETVSAPVATETAPAITKTEETPVSAAPVADATTTTAAAPDALTKEAAPTAAAGETTETKPVEAVNEGLLGYKAPGLLKQFTYAKKDFWFSDEPVAAENLHSYLRGEKGEIAHPVAAWSSQTGKGLLFFVKKGEIKKTHPAGVLPLYDATDLKRPGPLEFSFRVHNQNHSFKASSETECAGWYQSVEKSIEIGKASKESIVESEGYKAELKKLSSPGPSVSNSGAAAVTSLSGGVAAAGVAATSSAEPEQVDGAKRTGSDVEDKKATKSRSTSRGGVLGRLRGKKDELENKVEEKKEEKKIEKEEKKEIKKAEKEEKKIEKEEKKAEKDAVSPVPVATETAAPVEEKKDHTAEAAATGAAAGVVATEEKEKPKTNKRASIFGSLRSGFKSPIKEKDQKEAELKPEAAKDTVVSDAPPQLPETATATEPVAPVVASSATHTETTPAITEPAAESEAAKETSPETPSGGEKKKFLSGLPFIGKRDRSVSPSAPKETPAKETATTDAEKPVEGAAIIQATRDAEAKAKEDTTPAVATENEAEESSPAASKRQSVFGGLGRRASKMISRVQPTKKENTTPAAVSEGETKAVDEPVASAAIAPLVPAKDEPVTASETTAAAPVETVTEENKPETVAASSTAPVTASA